MYRQSLAAAKMSNDSRISPTLGGGGKSSKRQKVSADTSGSSAQLPTLPPPRQCESAADAFAKTLLKKSIANLCVSMGYSTADGAAFNALSQVARQKMLSLGRDLTAVAENSQRKQVTVEDFAECVSRPTDAPSTSREPLRYLVGVPYFPVETAAVKQSSSASSSTFSGGDMDASAVIGVEGLTHFPPLPPAHTYKRTRLDVPEIPASAAADLRRTQQRNSALVRESLARMRPKSENPSQDHSSTSNGETNNLARLMEGDFDQS